MCNKHQIITKNIAKEFLPKRPDIAHKYDFGHILIIAGSKYYPGAPVLATIGCLVSGCGVVSLAVPENVYPYVVAKTNPEVIVFSLPCTKEGTVGLGSLEIIIDYINTKKVNTVCVGCGLGINEETKSFVNNLIKILTSSYSNVSKELSVVIDADGFSLLEVVNKKIKSLPNKTSNLVNKNIILTPHLGEYKKLLNIQDEKFKKLKDVRDFDFCQEVQEFAKINNLVLILKSAITTISDGEYIFKTNTPNSALAKAGSGDVLAGLIAGLIHQIKLYNTTLVKYQPLLKSAVLAVYLQQRSAEIAKDKKTEFCFLPTDIKEFIQEVFKEINK
ncbi:MAG: NAD(P)H-hydrate dehydratase [Endomicrobiia bacterium]